MWHKTALLIKNFIEITRRKELRGNNLSFFYCRHTGNPMSVNMVYHVIRRFATTITFDGQQIPVHDVH